MINKEVIDEKNVEITEKTEIEERASERERERERKKTILPYFPEL